MIGPFLTFLQRKPDGPTVSAYADEVIDSATKFDSLHDDISAEHTDARSLIHGDPAPQMVQAAETAKNMATSVQRRSVVVGGAIHEFARGITEFNEQVVRWNTQIQDANDPMQAYMNLQGKYQAAEILREAEHTAITRINDWDSGSTVTHLWNSGALPISIKALFPGLELKYRNLEQLPPHIANLSPDDLHGLTLDEMYILLERARDLELDPADYSGLLETYYIAVAADKAGIDLENWDPSKGADELQGTIENVYTYYGDLYLDHPWLKWAGMANMVGPSFAGGFLDLDEIGGLASSVAEGLDDLPIGLGGYLPAPLDGVVELSKLSAADLANETRFYETTLLGMQQDIFFDMAGSHEAYLDGGMDTIEEMADAGVFGDRRQTDQAVQSWEQIDEGHRTGDNDLLNDGGRGLLFREQHDIIQQSYDDMYERPKTGPAMTYMMGAIGEPSVPGAHTLAELDPMQLNIPVNPVAGYSPEVVIDTPLPDGNLADFDTRWDMIDQDTLPAFIDLVDNDPARARDVISGDMHERIEEQRLANRIDSLAENFATNWDVHWKW